MPVVKFGSFWIANKSALTKAMENETIRTRRGRKTDAERVEIQAVRTEIEPPVLNSEFGGKQAYSPKRILKSAVKAKLARKPPTKTKKE